MSSSLSRETRLTPGLTFVATIALRLDAAVSVGETPNGVLMQLSMHGTVDGPNLKGEFRPGTLASLRIDSDGVGTIEVRTPLLLSDGARAELEATGRYDFGDDGYYRAARGPEHLPESELVWCPRILTPDPRYLWLNRTQFLGVGRLIPREARVNYDLYAVAWRSSGEYPENATAKPSLYERLGRREGIRKLMSAAIDSLHGNEQLNRQNPKIAAVNARLNPEELKEKVTDFICKVSGGPCVYRGRTMPASHSHLDVSEADWKLFIDETVKVMNRERIGVSEQTDLLALLESFKPEIVKP